MEQKKSSSTSSKWQDAIDAVDGKTKDNRKEKEKENAGNILSAPQEKKSGDNVLAQTASFWQRAAAWVWDFLIFKMIFTALAWIMIPPPPSQDVLQSWMSAGSSLPYGEDPSYAIAQIRQSMMDYAIETVVSILCLSFLFMILWSAYHIVCEKYYQTTFGKYLLGLEVRSIDHQELSWLLLIKRYIGCIFSWLILNVGHAMGAWRKDRQMLHDIWSKTTVVSSSDVFFLTLNPMPVWGQKLAMISAFLITLIICIASMWGILSIGVSVLEQQIY